MTSTVPSGMICTQEQWDRTMKNGSNNHNSTLIHCLSRGDSIGLTVVAQAGLISLAAVSYVFIIILRNVVWRIRHAPRNRMRIFHQPMDLLMFSLFSADILQAIGAVMDLKWIQQGRVEVGSFCNAQGIVQQLGETGVAVATLLIAIFTFVTVWTGKEIRSMWVTRLVVLGSWSIIVLLVILGNLINPHFQTPTPYWCWISPEYTPWRKGGEYAWFWVTLCFSFVSYTLLYFWSRGNIVIHDEMWWKVSIQKADQYADPAIKAQRRQSYAMLAYPFAYCITIIPFSVVRWITFSHPDVTILPSATFAVASIFGLSGLCNVILLLNTRPAAGLFDRKMVAASKKDSCSQCGQKASQMQMQSYEASHDYDNELGRLPSRES